jgi:hypothetical protein
MIMQGRNGLRFSSWLLVIFVLVGSQYLSGSDGDALLTIMATPTSYKNFPGHAFLIISVETKNGPKEEPMGFYPFPGNAIQAFIGGPGIIHDEFKKNPVRFSNVSASFQGPINFAQRKKIYDIADQFNTSHYDFTDSNCIDFIDSVVRAVGWKAPTRFPAQTPETYVKELRKLNQ